MRKILLILTSLFVLSALSGFGFHQQDSATLIQILNRSGNAATQITDGDTVQLQITLPQPVTTAQTITFKIDDQNVTVGSCVIENGAACQADSFLSLGWHWDAGGVAKNTRVIKAYDNGNNLLGQSESITVKPRPVVLVHGFISSWDAWSAYLNSNGYLASIGLQGFAVGDGQVEGSMNTGSMTTPVERTNTLAQNAEVEGQYIANVKKTTGAEMVDLVVHSMGGMISRYYIDRVMKDRDVAQLIMLGSPMGGSDCSVLPAALGFYLPASIEIRQSYMEGVFNKQITHRRGVEFHDLAGTAIIEAFKSPCTDIPNDMVVSLGSINAIPLQSSKFEALHSDLTSSRAVFENYISPLLERPAGSFTSAPDPETTVVKTPALQFTRVYTGRVDAGGSTELTINIDDNVTVASFALYDPTRSVTVSVRGASGNVIQLDAEKNGFVQITDPSSMFYLGYGFANPKPGPWKVTVLATDATPASGTDFSISVYFIGGATLDAQSNTLIPKPGEQIQFSASLALGGEFLEIQQARAIIRNPQGEIETVDFNPGEQISAAWTPRIVGTHAVDIVVTGITPAGAQIERTAFVSLEVQPNPSRLSVQFNIFLVAAGVLAILGFILYLSTRPFAKWFRRNR